MIGFVLKVARYSSDPSLEDAPMLLSRFRAEVWPPQSRDLSRRTWHLSSLIFCSIAQNGSGRVSK